MKNIKQIIILILTSGLFLNSVNATNLKNYQNGYTAYLEVSPKDMPVMESQQIIQCIEYSYEIQIGDDSLTHYCAGFLDGLCNSKKLLTLDMITRRIANRVFYSKLTTSARKNYASNLSKIFFTYYEKGLADGKSNRQTMNQK